MRPVDLRIIARDLGLICAMVGLMSVATLPVAASWGEHGMLLPFAIGAGLAFALAAALYFPFRGEAEAHLKHGLVIAATGWLLASLLCGVPLFIAAHSPNAGGASVFADYGNAWFEAMSGFTTTGLTMAVHPERLPHVLQWWRSFMQWIGGIGIIVMVLGLIPTPMRQGRALFFSEHDAKIHPTVSATIRSIWWIYLLYTFMGVILLWSVGMGMWDAINHTMAALSTGGFSTDAASMAHYSGWGVRLVVLLLMFLGALNFATHYDLLQGKKLSFHGNFLQAGCLLLFCAGAIGVLILENVPSTPSPSLATSAFQAVSALTTTGFQTESLLEWSEGAKLILILLMFIGGTSGSTAGGIKVMRAVMLIRGMGWWLSRAISSPSRLVGFRVGRERLTPEEADSRVHGAAVIFFAWLVCTLGGTLVLMHFIPEGYTLADSLFEVVSAQSTVGLSVGITHPEMSVIAKLVLIVNMWMGRVEVLPVLVMFRAIFRGLN